MDYYGGQGLTYQVRQVLVSSSESAPGYPKRCQPETCLKPHLFMNPDLLSALSWRASSHMHPHLPLFPITAAV